MKPRLARIVVALAVVTALGVVASAPAGATTKTKSSPAQDAAKAKAAMQPFLKIPTTLAAATPLPAAPKTGQTLVDLTCDNPSCASTAAGEAAAAAALGWTFKSVPFKLADTSTFISAMDSALAFKPAFVTFASLPQAVWAGEIPKYKAAGVGIVPDVAGTFKTDSTILGYSGDKSYAALAAQMLGDWFIQDSGGKGHLMLQNFPDVGVSVALTASMKKFVGANCKQCTVDTIDVPIAKLTTGQAPAVTVSAVQANPSVNYVFAADGSAALGLRSALNVIGRSDAKIGGLNGSYTDYTNVAAGTESAWINRTSGAGGYVDVDAGLHGMAGKKYQYKTDSYAPIMLVTKDNLPSLGGPEASKATGNFVAPSNYVDLYAKLWKVK